MEWANKQKIIASEAAAENKDSEEEKKREEFLVQKVWSVFLKKKMKTEMEKSAEINDAFLKIWNSTGLSNVQEIVDKFLKWEETYSELLKAVSNFEVKIDNLKRSNDNAMEEWHDMVLKDSKTASDPELSSLENKRESLSKDLEEAKDRSQRIEIVKDLIYGWT